MKSPDFSHLQTRFTQPRTDLPENEYEFWVNKTAKLIGRSYIQTAKLVENWPLRKIKQRYMQCTKHCPELTKPHIRWWALRKAERG